MKWAVAPFVFTAACAGGVQASDSPVQQQKAQAAQITRKCGLLEGTLIVQNDGSMRLRPKTNESYERVNCALGELQSRRLISNIPKAYVGNELYDENLQ